MKLTNDYGNPVREQLNADVFNGAFASVFTRECPITLTTYHRYNYRPMPDTVISPRGIANIIERNCLHLPALITLTQRY